MMHRPNERLLVVLATAGTLLAWTGRAATGVGMTEAFALRAGQEHQLPGASVYLSMVKVEEDSRCPGDVMCVWAGNAAVALTMRSASGPATTYRLNTTLSPRSITALGYEVRLDSLLPAPRMSQPTRQGDYVAYVTVVPNAP